MEAADRLLAWAREHWMDRGLPWRASGEPRVRRVLVEGLLAQTRADAVAAAYGDIFGSVFDARQWLWGEGRDLRVSAVAALGLPKLKNAALDSLARWLDSGGSARHLVGAPGVGPYTQGMVALLEGDEAAPVDCNVERVAARVDPTVSAAVWIAEVLAGAMRQLSPLPEFPAGYVAISAVLDIGATRCEIGRAPRCADCPLEVVCRFAACGPRQLEMWR
jgi:adenine-specific DNA glycosylase